MTFDEVKAAQMANAPLVYKKDATAEGQTVTVMKASQEAYIYVQTETDGAGSGPIHVTADQLSAA